jgi:hypothetical protein
MVALEQCRNSKNRRVFWAMKNEDYIADFILISRRVLTPEEQKLFRLHFLLGADWQLYCPREGMDRGTFFHALYRVQRKMGRALVETKPYGLFPLDEYFGTVVESARKPPARAESLFNTRKRVLRPPVLKTA